MKLKVVTPQRVVFEDDNVDAVYAMAIDGEVGILPNHVPLVTPLDIGVLHYKKGNHKQAVTIMGGLLRTNGQSVSILTHAAEQANEIDPGRAKEAKNRAESGLQSATDKHEHQMALKRATARLKVVENR
ncbi:MAG: ATP synthase F1 subunit epsilon [Cyanobacteria bacterium HKST-UBA04]|nr:ATP synthase F1 subunit epsilon [Cyanobacteria bacterium HKST-UBA04]MCA9840513.1 ATP synthase F1 subunit epsilon [Cyanobacteria bacterium HKST-UBA03]